MSDTSYIWTAEDVKATAEEFGFDPDNFAKYMNKSEAYDTAFHNRRRAEELRRLRHMSKLAHELGITSAAEIWDKEIEKRVAWINWRADPENNPFPGFD